MRAIHTFRSLVKERGDELRKLPFENLRRLTAGPTEQITVGKRRATIDIIVQPLPSGGIMVVVQGFLKHKFLRFVKDVSVDGFCKYPDEKMATLTGEGIWGSS